VAQASTEKRGPKGVRPLQLAAWTNAAEAADVLMRHGARVDALDKQRRTACHAAAASDGAECLEVLLEGGGDVRRGDARGRTPLHYAVQSCGCS
jgi:ankyrin repeat protein